MKKYKVEITETLQRIVEIEATSAGEAVQKIRKQYKEKERYLIDSSLFCYLTVLSYENIFELKSISKG